MFMGRRLKTTLPTALLKPKVSDDIHENLKLRQFKQQTNFNRHAPKSGLKPLQENDVVMMKTGDEWKHGTVIGKHRSPRSYVAQNNNGRKYRRDRKQLKMTKSLPTPQYEELESESIVPTRPTKCDSKSQSVSLPTVDTAITPRVRIKPNW